MQDCRPTTFRRCNVETSASPLLTAPSGADATVALRNVFLHVTKACNLRCRYCYFSASRPLPDEMTSADFDRLWPDLIALRPRKVVFTGGEPLLRPDIFHLLSRLQTEASGQCITRSLNTNGLLVTVEIAMRLAGLIDEVRVSLDGPRAQNDFLRGGGSFDAALRALACFQDAGFDPGVLVTVTSVTLPYLEDLLCLLIKHGITNINLNPFRPIGRGRRNPDWLVRSSDIHGAIRRGWERCYPGRSYIEPPPETPTQVHCGVGHFLNVMPNGDVFPCHVLEYPEFRLGNVIDERLHTICRRTGLLGELADLDFGELAAKDAELAPLTRSHTCMATVYAETRLRPAWRDTLPLLAIATSEDMKRRSAK
jgi:mycofactocin biosynthetic radical S-adenosylmethionine protein MftC